MPLMAFTSDSDPFIINALQQLQSSTLTQFAAMELINSTVQKMINEYKQGQANADAKQAASEQIDASRPLRPGQLPVLVAEFLQNHQGKVFTASGIAKNIGRSAGAINNALQRMVTKGQVHQVGDQPRRYQLAKAAIGPNGEKRNRESKAQVLVLFQEAE